MKVALISSFLRKEDRPHVDGLPRAGNTGSFSHRERRATLFAQHLVRESEYPVGRGYPFALHFW